MSKRQISSFLGGVALGSAVGTVMGLLVAPRSGKETRKILKKSAQALPEVAEDVSSSVQLQAGRFSETTFNNWEGTLGRLKEAIAAGIEARQAVTASSEPTSESFSSTKPNSESE